MDILYFQCLSGISGDMTVAALLDLGVDQTQFLEQLQKLNLSGYQIRIERKQKNGITGTKFTVLLDDEGHPDAHHQKHQHNHAHIHDQDDEHEHEDSHTHGHGHSHDHGDGHNHGHNHGTHIQRNLFDIEKLIDASDVTDRVKELSKTMFGYVAAAEAKVHDKPLSEVHFHEVGAVDSIVDIVGTAIAIDMLGSEEIYASPLHVGTGFVKCQHGRIPVPAPATVEILKGVPIYSKGIQSELVTPTGAAIIKTLAKDYIPLPEMVIEEVGYGLGTKELPVTNALRVFKGKKKALNPFSS